MGNKPRKNMCLDDICKSGPPVRVSDLVGATGLAEITIKTDIRDGHLKAHRRVPLKQNSPYFVDRKEARRWLMSMGFIRE